MSVSAVDLVAASLIQYTVAHLSTCISIGLLLSKLFYGELFLSSSSILLFLLLTSRTHCLKLQDTTGMLKWLGNVWAKAA